jgi:hypothetical protein
VEYVDLEHQWGIRDSSDVPEHVVSRCETAIPSNTLFGWGSLSVNHVMELHHPLTDGWITFDFSKENMPGTHAYKH